MAEVKEITSVNNLPRDWFAAFTAEAEAIEAADLRGEPFVFYHAASKTWFVADKAKDAA